LPLELRALDPVFDFPLFRESYDWRGKPASKLRPDKMSFEDVTSHDPSQVVMGLFFDGQLCAVYLIKEGPTVRGETFFAFQRNGQFDIHYTSRPGALRQHLIAGGTFIVNWLLSEGAVEVGVWLVARNRIYVAFAEECGLRKTESRMFTTGGQLVEFDRYAASSPQIPLPDNNSSGTLPVQTKEFVHYTTQGR